MHAAEYYACLQKAGEFALKAREERDPLSKRALEGRLPNASVGLL
jgi:hypothetical protein